MPSVPNPLPYLAVIALGVLAGCGTPEYQAERQHCEAEWMLKIPPEYRQNVVTKYRSEERLTGQTVCKTTGDVTNCTQITRTISVPYTEVETVDIRAAQRNPQIASCTARACTAKYGNAKCEM